MHKAVKISGIVILFLAAVFIAGTSRVDHKPYYEADYFKNTFAQLDSLKHGMVVTNGPLEAGFSRVSITPDLNHQNDDWEKGRFRHVPLAGYGARKTGQLTSGIAMFFAGPMGSQRPYGQGRELERAKFIGEALADSTVSHYPSVIMRDSVILAPLSLKIELPPYHIRLTPKISLSSYLSRKLMPYPRNVYIQAVRIGNLIWITVPAELSGELALQIKNSLSAFGYDCLVTSFNGSYIGYIIPGKYFYMDKYEPKTMGWFGPYLGDYTMDLIRYLYTILINQ